MTHKALIRQLQISCLGLDAVDPLRLLVDDVIAALAQPPQQEPVKDWVASHNAICALLRQAHDALALTSYPMMHRWVGLTEDDKVLIKHDANFNQFMTAGEYADRVQQLTEARLKDKNT